MLYNSEAPDSALAGAERWPPSAPLLSLPLLHRFYLFIYLFLSLLPDQVFGQLQGFPSAEVQAELSSFSLSWVSCCVFAVCHCLHECV